MEMPKSLLSSKNQSKENQLGRVWIELHSLVQPQVLVWGPIPPNNIKNNDKKGKC